MKLLYRTHVVDDFWDAVFYDVTSYPKDTISTTDDVDPTYLMHCKPFHENGKYNARHSTEQLNIPQRSYTISKKISENLLLIFTTPETYYEPIDEAY